METYKIHARYNIPLQIILFANYQTGETFRLAELGNKLCTVMENLGGGSFTVAVQ